MSESDFQLGDGDLHAGKKNMAMLRRAFNERWPMSPEIRRKVIEQMHRIVAGSGKNRDKIAAAKVLVAADAVNVKDEERRNPTPKLIEHVVVDARRDRLADIAARLDGPSGPGVVEPVVIDTTCEPATPNPPRNRRRRRNRSANAEASGET